MLDVRRVSRIVSDDILERHAAGSTVTATIHANFLLTDYSCQGWNDYVTKNTWRFKLCLRAYKLFRLNRPESYIYLLIMNSWRVYKFLKLTWARNHASVHVSSRCHGQVWCSSPRPIAANGCDAAVTAGPPDDSFYPMHLESCRSCILEITPKKKNTVNSLACESLLISAL